MKRLNNNEGFLTILGMVFALVLVCWMVYITFHSYLLQPKSSTGGNEGAGNIADIKSQTRQKIEVITQQHTRELDSVEKELKQ